MKLVTYIQLLLVIIINMLCLNSFAKSNYKVIDGMKFHSFTLKNKLEVLVVSDKRFIKSTAALAVKAGSQDNPKEHLGLAHYLEHMLFLGTKDYPVVGEYEDFLNKNGGSHNAYTAMDHTNYFFDIDPVGFEDALKRFSRFFVNPTFDEKYLEREKNAVNSEHEKNLKNDPNREHRFIQTLFNDKHPHSLFATGNAETLKNAKRDDVIKFYEGHYSSNTMKLVLMSNLDVEAIEKLAHKYFDDIPNRNLTPMHVDDALFAGQKLPQFHEVQSIKDQEILRLAFNIPDDMPYWQSKPVSLIGELLGHEGEGSLLSYLKSKGYALGLSAGGSSRLFDIRVTLTEKGKKHYHDVLDAIFSYIEMVKAEGLKQYIFDEKKILAQVELNNLEPNSSSDRSSSFSAAMLDYPVEEFLERYYLFHRYDTEDFKKFLSYLRADNLHVVLFSKNVKGTSTEKFYHVAYNTKPFADAETKKLKSPPKIKEFKYPIPNPFIPTDFSLVQKKSLGDPVEKVIPNRGTVYYQIDTELEVPKGSITMSISSDKILANPKNYLKAKFFSILKEEELNEWGYNAKVAGLNYSVSFDFNTLTLSAEGYTQNLQKLIDSLVSDPSNGRSLSVVKTNKDLFEKIRSKFKKNLENKNHDAAYQALMYEYNNLINTSSVHYKDFIKDVDTITLDEINSFMKTFFQQIHVKVYAYGNIDPKSFEPMVNNLYEKMGSKFIAEADLLKFENNYIKLSGNKTYALSGDNNNDAMLTLFKLSDWDIDTAAKISVLGKVVEQPYFTELRTHQQLGYVVSGFGSSNNGFCALGGVIQSQVQGPIELLKRSDAFYNSFFETLSKNLTDEDVKMINQSIINEISLMPNSLAERAGRFISLAGGKYGDFKFYDKMEKHVKKVTKENLLAWVKQFRDNKNSTRINLLYFGSKKKVEIVPGSEMIKDLKAFKSSSEKHQPYRDSKNLN